MSPVHGADAVLLDTNAVIRLAGGEAMDKRAIAAIDAARATAGVYVSPVSAWEIGLLSRPQRARPLEFAPDPKTWFARFMAQPGVREAPFTAEIAIESSHLPGVSPNDPADRLLIATARHLNLTLVTRDREIIGYARAGYVRVVPC
jgi:PIN domain nuclease of toxin-antitoxin system